jgi:hypothetical protein
MLAYKIEKFKCEEVFAYLPTFSDSKSVNNQPNHFDKTRLPMSPRDLSAGVALSPRFHQFKSRLNQTVGFFDLFYCFTFLMELINWLCSPSRWTHSSNGQCFFVNFNWLISQIGRSSFSTVFRLFVLFSRAHLCKNPSWPQRQHALHTSFGICIFFRDQRNRPPTTYPLDLPPLCN